MEHATKGKKHAEKAALRRCLHNIKLKIMLNVYELLFGTFDFNIILYWNGQLVWTPALALYLCVGDCIQRDLSPTSGYTGISARRRYQFWERY